VLSLPCALAEGSYLSADVFVALRSTDSTRLTTFTRPDGTFKFNDVASGTYYVEVEALGYQFLSVRLLNYLFFNLFLLTKKSPLFSLFKIILYRVFKSPKFLFLSTDEGGSKRQQYSNI
jgi:Protein of unknown function (DUF2012)